MKNSFNDTISRLQERKEAMNLKLSQYKLPKQKTKRKRKEESKSQEPLNNIGISKIPVIFNPREIRESEKDRK